MYLNNGLTEATDEVLENITHTLLYEGYALYPYHRSSVKNRKPIPFGVVFPQQYNAWNEHAHANMQTQCIVTGPADLKINVTVRFLHLIKVDVLKRDTGTEHSEDKFLEVDQITIGDKFYQAGWQTRECSLGSGELSMTDLVKKEKVLSLEYEAMHEDEQLFDKEGTLAAKRLSNISEIQGLVTIDAVPEGSGAFRLTVSVINTTPLENPAQVNRDEVLSQSFLSTHTIIKVEKGIFISHQNPGKDWEAAINSCQNIHTWPILVREDDATLLSSPIIIYDYPRINPQSSGDLFDSTEIEEALLLHVAMLSDEEKQHISQSDEKLKAMLNKVSQVTPEELIHFHSGLKSVTENQGNNEKIAES